MLTIQPNFSYHKANAMTSFGHTAVSPQFTPDDLEDFDFQDLSDSYEFESNSEKDKELKSIKQNIKDTVSNLQDIEDVLPDGMKNVRKGINILYTLGGACLTGISMKFGFAETSRQLAKVGQTTVVKNAKGNIASLAHKLSDNCGKLFEKVKNTKFMKKISEIISQAVEKFKNKKIGQKIMAAVEKMENSKFAAKIKSWFGSAKKVDSQKIVDRTGDVLGAATGVSTAAVGFTNNKTEGDFEE